ncbi:MAG: hypothetical protein DRH90_14035 [Deltaproteobacteria bacterium]|nr:MAG: hypothetical protein DRH90_14035 [Deltaproteobacteria bacterium]
MGERQLKFLEFVPLILYFTFARAAGPDSAGRQWEIAFVIGGVLSVVALSVLLRHGAYILNRVMLGANLFLISGALAVALGFAPLLDIYRRFNPAPMFAWVIAVGIATSLFSAHGFIGSSKPGRQGKHLHSVLLLAAAFAALGISAVFRGQIFYADILPFIGLFIVNDRLQSRTPNTPG